MNRNSRIYVAGGDTLIGHALRKRLCDEGYDNLVGVPPHEPDLMVRGQVEDFFVEYRPEYVFVAAGKSGGIALNRSQPADLMLDNLLVVAHLLDAAHIYEVRKLLYVASSCSYPRQAPQPLRVESLLTGPLEPTNAAYAMAKLAGWQLGVAYRQQHGANFVTAIPGNAFGPHDDFAADTGHVIPALIRKAHEAKQERRPSLSIWGTGTPRRDFIYASDLADACLFVMKHHDGEQPINLGNNTSYTIAEVAHAIAEIVGYRGRLDFEASKPDGMPLKMLDATPLREMGWQPTTDFRTALTETYHWFLQHEVMEDPEDVRSAVSIPVSHPPGRRRDRPRLPQR